ncbi:MAG: NMD3-related protein [Archaeoglobaceae archaeon]
MRCVICGRESEEVLCAECAAERLELAVLDTVEIVMCSGCRRFKLGASWAEVDLEEAVAREVARSLRVDERFRVESVEVRGNVAVLRGKFGGEELEVSIPFNYNISRSRCPRCSRQSGGYYEAIIQLRAEGRKLEEEEIRRAKEILISVLETDRSEKAFLSKVQERKEGIDFYVGSRDVGRRASYRIADEMGGKVTESKKLHTKIDGRDAYRFTYLVRLPPYRVGDVVEVNGRLAVVRNARLGKGTDLISGKTVSVADSKVVARREDMTSGIIVNVDEYAAEVSCDFGLVIVEKPYGAEIGSVVNVFEHGGKYWAFVP